MILCTSCNDREIYSQYRILKDARWPQEDIVVFDIDSTLVKPGVRYNISLELTNNINYPYQNIWLFVKDNMNRPDSMEVSSIEAYLADDKGKWLGGGSWSLFQLTVPYKKDVMFPDKRNYQIRVSQGMRDEMLDGIERVGLKISESK